MADANSAYTLADADHLAQLDAFDLIMIEQPLSRDDLVRHAALQRRLRTPICLDESITSVDRAEDMIALGAGRIINIKPGRVGGFAVSKAIHDVCARSSDSRVVRRHAGERRRTGAQRGARVAAELPTARRPLAERAILGARHRDSRVDDGRRRHGAGPVDPRRASASRSTWIASTTSRCGTRRFSASRSRTGP